MNRTLIALALALAITGCGEEKKVAKEDRPSNACREASGRLIYAMDQEECERYYKGEWEGD